MPLPQQATPSRLPQSADPPRGRALSPPVTARPTATPAKCGGGITFESLQLNAAAQELWGCWGNGTESGVAAVMLTFGSHSMADFLLNWVEHVKRLGQRLYLVGALDERMEQLCAKHGTHSPCRVPRTYLCRAPAREPASAKPRDTRMLKATRSEAR